MSTNDNERMMVVLFMVFGFLVMGLFMGNCTSIQVQNSHHRAFFLRRFNLIKIDLVSIKSYAVFYQMLYSVSIIFIISASRFSVSEKNVTLSKAHEYQYFSRNSDSLTFTFYLSILTLN